jgi:hypothetical protein
MNNHPPAAQKHVTTEDLLAVTKSTRDTLYRWVGIRLLPKPRILTDSKGRHFAAWSADSLERVRFIVDKEREGLMTDDIIALVAGRWPTGSPTSRSRRG